MFHSARFTIPIAVLALTVSCDFGGVDVGSFLTRAELTEYRETSTSAEVQELLAAIGDASRRVHVTRFGHSYENRPLELAVYGNVADATPDAVHQAGGTRILITANIHAGEVDGKEAMLMLLRSLAAGERAHWADSLVLLVVPNFNPDGNDAMSPTNRPRQHGPIAGVGTRTNAQGFNLNRDFMKLEAPETMALMTLFNAYDPHVYVDLHATNGTRTAYHLTYAPPLHPNTDSALVSLLREQLLPEVTHTIRELYGWEYFHYGNLFDRDPEARPQWRSFSHMPRFSTNYAGMRNRLGILSESYVYATFEERTLASKRFVEEIAECVHQNAAAVRQATAEADDRPLVGTRLAISAEPYNAGQVEILLGDVVEEENPITGNMMYRRTDDRRPITADDMGHFRGTETERVPYAYLVPEQLEEVLDKLEGHGVRWTALESEVATTLERFAISSHAVAARESEGRRFHTLTGEWEAVQLTLPAGTIMVPVEQPLGRLLFYLLEPLADDGLARWGFVTDPGTDYYPVHRIHQPLPAITGWTGKGAPH